MKKNENGFTLVELAVSMIIIGLLIGGILVGTNLIEQAKVSETIKFANSTSAAVNSFYEKYRARPGDALRATSQVQNCNTAHHCTSGNGNNYITSDGFTDNVYWNSDILGTATDGEESFQFWKHLALSEIMAGIDPMANTADSTTMGWAKSHPSSPFGGGFEMYYDPAMATGGGGSGNSASHILRLSASGVTGPGNLGAVNTVNSAAIDQKMDDGDPSAGILIGSYGSSNNDCKTTTAGQARYNSDEPQNLCVLYFRLFAR